MKHKQVILDKLRSDLIKHLKKTKITQIEIANLLNCDQGTISKFLSGNRGLSAERALRLYQILNQ